MNEAAPYFFHKYYKLKVKWPAELGLWFLAVSPRDSEPDGLMVLTVLGWLIKLQGSALLLTVICQDSCSHGYIFSNIDSYHISLH